MKVSEHILRLTSDPRIIRALSEVKDEAERARMLDAMNRMLADTIERFSPFVNVDVPPEHALDEKSGGVIGRVEVGGDK